MELRENWSNFNQCPHLGEMLNKITDFLWELWKGQVCLHAVPSHHSSTNNRQESAQLQLLDDTKHVKGGMKDHKSIRQIGRSGPCTLI